MHLSLFTAHHDGLRNSNMHATSPPCPQLGTLYVLLQGSEARHDLEIPERLPLGRRVAGESVHL